MRFATLAHHFSHPQSSPVMQSHPTGAWCQIVHKSTSQTARAQKNYLGKDSKLVTTKWVSLSPVENNPGGFPRRKQSLAASSLNSHLCLCREVQIAPPRAASPGGFILTEGKLCSQPPFEQILCWEAAFIQGRSSTSAPQQRHTWVCRNCHSWSICSYGDTPSLLWLPQEESQPFPSGKEGCWVPGRSWNNLRLKADWEVSYVKTNREVLNQPQPKPNHGRCVRSPHWEVC